MKPSDVLEHLATALLVLLYVTCLSAVAIAAWKLLVALWRLA